MTFKLLDLFSGIGGFSLGLERSGAFKTVAFCEIESFPRAVLKKHWPHVPQYNDVRKLTAARLAADGIEVDAICGGFPCQDVSLAGRRAGLAGKRSGLWVEFARLISELRPRIVIVENTPGLLSKGMGTVLGDLAAIGFDAEWHCLPASALGARHKRNRVWIVAYPASERHEIDTGAKWGEAAAQLLAGRREEWPALPEIRRAAYGLPDRLDRLRALGNAVVPQVAELIGTSIARAA